MIGEFSFLASAWSPSSSSSSSSAQPSSQSGPIVEEVGKLYSEYADALTRYLVHEFGPEGARDATQEAFLRFFEKRLAGEVIQTPKGWISTVARRLLLNREKLGRKFAVPLEPEHEERDLAPSPEDIWIEREHVVIAHATMRDELSEVERRCLEWRLQGLKLKEIARLLADEMPEQGLLDHRRVSEILDRATTLIARRVGA